MLRSSVNRLLVLGVCSVVLLIGACSNDPDEVVYVERTVENLYNDALNKLQAREYVAAAKTFD